MYIKKKELIVLSIASVIIVLLLILCFVPMSKQIIAPTCESAGYTVKQSVFGVEYRSNVVSALGHQYENGHCTKCRRASELTLTNVEFMVDGNTVDSLTIIPNSQKQIHLQINNGDPNVSKNSYSVNWAFKDVITGATISKSGLISIGNIEGKIELVVKVSAKNTYTRELPIFINIYNDNIKSISIEFTKQNNTFIEGQTIEKSDLIVWGELDDGRVQIIDYEYDNSPMHIETKEFTVNYGGMIAIAAISVLPKRLQSIEISQSPTITEYYIGQCFDSTGMVVIAHYEYIQEEITPDIDLKPLTLDDTEIVVSYTFDGIAKTASQKIIVIPKQAIFVDTVEILVDEIAVTDYSVVFPNKEINAKIKINDGEEIDAEKETYSILWNFSGESCDSVVSKDGKITLGDFIGDVNLVVTIVGTNSKSAMLHIHVSYPDTYVLDSISAMLKDENVRFTEGQRFDCNDVIVWGHFGDTRIRILNFEYEDVILTSEVTEMLLSFEDKIAIVPIVVDVKTLQSIEIVNPPNSTEYYDGQEFDPSGMVVVANFEYIREEIIADIDSRPLKLGDTEVTISYTYQGITKTVNQPITVVPKKLLSISVDETNVRKSYTQYDFFDPEGLVVKATYDYFGEILVNNYTYSQIPLLVTDSYVEIKVQEGSVIKTAMVSIEVFAPYERKITLKVLKPIDMTISWIYAYNTADGDREINSTDFSNHNLIYDKVNGVYEIPVGAYVTAIVMNPAVNKLLINGVEQPVKYTDKTVSWEIRNVDDLFVGSVEMTGKYYVIRFMGDDKEQSFLFESSWNGILTENALTRLASVFADNENFYYSYLYNGRMLMFNDLSDYAITGSAIISVLKNSKTNSPITVKFHLSDSTEYTIQLSKTEVASWDIPIITPPAGYLYDGLSLKQNGEKLSDSDIKELLLTNDFLSLYVRLIPEIVDYSEKCIVVEGTTTMIKDVSDVGDSIISMLVGLWTAEFDDETDVRYNIQFSADGSFEYEGYIDNVLNCRYAGNYRISGNKIVIISIQTDLDILLLNSSDFSIEADNMAITANIVIVAGETVDSYNVDFTRIND